MSREREHAHPVFVQVDRPVAAAVGRGGYGQLRVSVQAYASGGCQSWVGDPATTWPTCRPP